MRVDGKVLLDLGGRVRGDLVLDGAQVAGVGVRGGHLRYLTPNLHQIQHIYINFNFIFFEHLKTKFSAVMPTKEPIYR